MEIYAMKPSYIVLVTVLQVVTSMTLAERSINPTGTNNYRQVKAHGRALDHRNGQLLQQVSVPRDRTFARVRLPETHQSADNRRPTPTVGAFVQRHQQQPQQHSQLYDAAMSSLDWTPIVQPKELQETVVYGRPDYQQRQVRQPDAIVTFVTAPPRDDDEPRPPNHSFGGGSDDFRIGYGNASASPEANSKHHHVTYGGSEKKKTRSRNGHGDAAKGQNKHRPKVYAASNDENGGRSYSSDFEHEPSRDPYLQQLGKADMPQLADENDKNASLIVGVRSDEQKRGESEHLRLGESKSDVLRYDHSKAAAAAADREETDDIDAIEQLRPNYRENVDGGDNNSFRDDSSYYQQNVDVIGDDRENSTPPDTVDTSSKAQKHEYGVRNLYSKSDPVASEKHLRASNQYTNVTAAGLRPDDKTKSEIEQHRRRKPSVIAGVNPNISTTASSPRQRPRKVQSSVQTRRSTADDNGTVRRTLYGGQNGYERNDNHGRITTPSDNHPLTVTAFPPTSVLVDVIGRPNDYDGSASGKHEEEPEQGGYGFGYTVLDENVGMDFGQWERREPGRTGIVTGLYRVRLPDGRTQTVEYTVGPATGYRASVTYEGIQHHPAPAPPLVERFDSTAAETQSSN